VTWAQDEQLAIARWSLKTALMLDRSRRKPWATPPEHCTFLLEAEEPPGSVQISLARYFPTDGDKPLDIGAAVTVLADVDSRFPRDLGAYRIVYNIGQAVFQVVGHNGVEARGFGVSHVAWGTLEGERVLRPFNDVFRTLWPQSGEAFEWPPADGPLNTESLRALGPNL